MIGDLHIHTRHSDGSNTVREALLEAKLHGLSYVSIVDHDTTEGLDEAVRLGTLLDLTVVSGVEISAFDFSKKKKVHILGYGFELPASNITELCAPLLERRHQQTLKQISCLREHGYDVSENEAREAARGPAAGRPTGSATRWPDDPVLYKQHIMAVLLEKGYTNGIYSDLYVKLFKEGPCTGDIEYVDVFDAVRAVVADGGTAVLAHPGQQDSYHLIDDLVAAGLGGIELYHEDNDREDHRRIRAAAKKHGLVLTGGSDDHGEFGSSHLLGEIVAPYGTLGHLVSTRRRDVDWATALVREAGDMARRAVLSDIETSLKGGDIRDLVTEHDREIDRFLTDEIRRRFPDHGFITEEHDHPEVGHDTPVWIIDPIDGTTNFVSAGSYFAVSVAHYVGSRPVFGIVYDVMADDLYVGIPGDGAFLNGRRLAGWSSKKALSDCVVEASSLAADRLRDWYDADGSLLLHGFRAQRAYGCASLGICRIARGTLDVYISSSLSVWDYAAAVVVLNEVGGSARLIAGPDSAELSGPFHDDRCGVVASGHPGTTKEVLARYVPGAPQPRMLTDK